MATYQIGFAYVVTQELTSGSWLATYPGFAVTAKAESDALVELAKEMRSVVNAINAKAIEIVHSFSVGNKLRLTRDCDLGRAGEEFFVEATDGEIMSLSSAVRHADQQREIFRTSCDYKWLKKVG